MDEYRGVFAKYLKDRKGIHIDDVSSTEAYARFKSFVHKWFLSLEDFADLGMKETFHRNTMILKTIGNEQICMVTRKILDNIPPRDKKGSIHGRHRPLDRPSQRKKTSNSKKVHSR
jgi:hypothetical protein